jgi:hypothetical protein
MLIPKGAAQAAKTVLGFFTHAIFWYHQLK